MKFIRHLFGRTLVAGMFCVAAVSAAQAETPAPTAEQMQKFQQLSPAQREAVQRALQGSAVPPPSPPSPMTAAAAPQPAAAPAMPPSSSVTEAPGTLKPFGYDYFSTTPDIYALAADLPVPDDYVVGPGDMVLVQLYGKENTSYELPVTREGIVQFPGIGPIRVGGQPYVKMRDLLMRRVQGQFIGLKASVQIGRTRNIQIFVLGDVVRPGSYTVSGLSTLTNAIFASGGIKRIGSLRQIQLKRQGKPVATMDLYDLLLKGDNTNDARLQPGDVIFVPPLGKIAGISGEVQRPAIYELRNETALEELVTLAGGLTAKAFPHTMQIERIQDNRERTVVDIDMTKPEGGKTPLVSGDMAHVYGVSDQVERVVNLAGFTKRAGTYQWTEGMRLTNLIASLGDLPSEVDGSYQLIRRENAADRTVELLNANLGAALAAPESDANIVLQPRDTVYVFGTHDDRKAVIEPLMKEVRVQSRPDRPEREVTIGGVVHHAGRYPFVPGMRVSDLLRAGGGLTDKAYVLEGELTRFSISEGKQRKQETVVVNIEGALRQDSEKDLALNPYDQLVIHRIPSWSGEGSVTLRGEVAFPGTYPVARGEKLSSVLKRAGGKTAQGFARGAVFLRESVRAREQEFMDRVARQLEEEIAVTSVRDPAAGVDKKEALAEAKNFLAQIKATHAMGRVSIKLDDLLDGDADQDITLQDGDSLFIPQRPDEVTVTGEVYFPTSHLYKKGRGRDDYVSMSGGVTERGNKGSAYVVHADGSVSAAGGWFSWGPRMGPGDTVVVPVKVERVSMLKLAVDVTQVMYQIAVTAATLKVLKIL